MWSWWLIHQYFVNNFREFLELTRAVDISKTFLVEANATLNIFADLFDFTL
jgi:hypothetical protein